MKLLTLLSLYLLLAFSTHAQALSWLHGDWTGETYFPNGPITKRIVVKLRVTKVTGSRFEAFLDNLYPNDTTIRLERKITGYIINKKMHIKSSEQVYIRDPRTQNFWRDCTGCDIQSAFSIGSEQLEIKLKTTNCSDECNGETTFSRDTSELNAPQQKDLAKWFHLPASKLLAKAGSKQPKDSSASASKAPLHHTENKTGQELEADTEDGSVTALETFSHKPVINPTQIQRIKDNLPDTQNIQTAIRNADDKQIGEPASFLPGKADSSFLPSTVQSQKKEQAKQRSGDSPVTLQPSARQKPVSGSTKKKDTLAVAAANAIQAGKDSLAKQAAPKADSTPNALTTRTTTLINTFQVSSPHIVIQLFDNAEIDGDIVTVYHNGQMIVNRQSLTHKAITITIDASKENAHHEFIMTADNLGLIPPNTALMRISAGEQKFELEVSSDFDNNSKITIDYTGE